MKLFLIVILIFIMIIGGFAAYFVSIYNSLIRLKNNINKAWSNIDVLLKQRFDEIPKLVNVCKGYIKHEREVLESVIRARSMLSSAQTGKEKIKANDAISNALKSLFAVAEQYPDLKADAVFMRLGIRISELENQISDRREMYNESVNLYNIRIEQFPDILLARLFQFEEKHMWKIDPDHRKDVEINIE